MDWTELLTELQELLQREEPLTPEMELDNIPEWDSLSAMAVSGYFDTTLKCPLTADELADMRTVSDLLSKVDR